MEQKTVLIADDEPHIRTLVSDFLKKSGYRVLEAEDGAQALELYRSHPELELLILDIMMPELDGWELTRRVRETSLIPILLLSARSEEFDQLTGFEAGADDYVTKPFSPAVLVKRVNALLRRTVTLTAGLGSGELLIDTQAYTVYLRGQPLELTLKEFEILNKLYSNPGRVFTRDQLLDDIWGFDFNGDPRTVDSHVARLRTKLGDYGNTHLKTVYGLGYKIEV